MLTQVTKDNEKVYRKYLVENVNTYTARHIYDALVVRCTKYKESTKTYYGLPVEWENSAAFLEWFYEVQTSYRAISNVYTHIGYQIDKDILTGYKSSCGYGPDSCVFVPKYINGTLEKATSRGKLDLPIGVFKGRHQDAMPVYINILGMDGHKQLCRAVNDKSIAFYLYKYCREHYIHLNAEESYRKCLITKEVYDKMINWEIFDSTGIVSNDEYPKQVARNIIGDRKLFPYIDRLFDQYSVPYINNFFKLVIPF